MTKKKLLHAAACLVSASVKLISKAAEKAEAMEERRLIQDAAIRTGRPIIEVGEQQKT